MSTNLKLIKSNDYLDALSDSAAEALAAMAQEQAFAAGERLTTELTPDHRIWLIVEGEVEGGIVLANVSRDAGSQTVGPGELVGLLHFVDPSAATLTMTARTDLKTLVWEVSAWRDLCEAHPRDGYHIAMGIAGTLLKRMLHYNVHVLDDLAWGIE